MKSNNSWVRHYLMLFSIAVVLIILDQWSKGWVRQNIPLGAEIYPIPALAPFFRFTYWQNTGAALGFFQNANTPLLIFSSIIVVVIIWYYHKAFNEPLLFRISLSLLLGGAIGNIIDRIQLDFVTDFIAVGRFPVFNVADSAVTVGVIIMLIGLLIQEHREKTKRETAAISMDTEDEN